MVRVRIVSRFPKRKPTRCENGTPPPRAAGWAVGEIYWAVVARRRCRFEYHGRILASASGAGRVPWTGISLLGLLSQALDLLASALEEGQSGDRQSSTCRALTVMRIKDIIEFRLSKPDLSCAGIAAEAGISRRYLSRLFEAEDISVETYIKRRRLEMCREALQSKQQASRSIGEISFGWGFKDAAHFSRSFKAYYNELPRNYRSS